MIRKMTNLDVAKMLCYIILLLHYKHNSLPHGLILLFISFNQRDPWSNLQSAWRCRNVRVP